LAILATIVNGKKKALRKPANVMRQFAVTKRKPKMIMRKTVYFSLFVISILGTLVAPYGIVNTMVSLKYETENIQDCVSNVSGENLCDTIRNLKIVFVFCVSLLIFLIYFRKKILKPKLTKEIKDYNN
jgi:amino acid transporter